MVATWSFGVECDKDDFAAKLSDAPFAIIVIVWSNRAVEERDRRGGSRGGSSLRGGL